MPYTYTLTSLIPATPAQIYAAWLDSLAHTDMTGGKASMSDEVGAVVSAWDGYITGRNLDLVPGKRIVQSWRTSRFTDAHADSIVTLTLRAAASGTVLTLEHSNVPDDQRNYEDGGWEDNYFQPMKEYFVGLAQDIGERLSQPAKVRAKRPAKSTRAKPRKLSRAAPRKKQQRAQPKGKHLTAPNARRKVTASPPKKRKSAKKTTRSPATRRARKAVRRQRARR